MKEIQIPQTVHDWFMSRYPLFDTQVSVSNPSADEKIIEDFYVRYSIRKRAMDYKRYGYAAADLVANMFANACGAFELGFVGTLTNSGMSAVDVVLRAMQLRPGDCVLTGKTLYSETAKLFQEWNRIGVILDRADTVSNNHLSFGAQLSPFRLAFFETLGSGPALPVLPTVDLLKKLWDKDITLVLDNTLPGGTLDVFRIYAKLLEELHQPRMRLVYLESLSKYYRVMGPDDVTAGIILSCPGFIDQCNDVVSRSGQYLPYSSLAKLPFELYEVGRRNACAASEAALKIADFLKTSPLVREVSYPTHYKGGAGAVIYFRAGGNDPFWIANAMYKVFGLPRRSYGHPLTTWLPFGTTVEPTEPELIRLSAGYHEDAGKVIAMLEEVFEKSSSTTF